ncbi:hypothetical protein BD626DRAFT_493819 [Schizophyllum amplum]|uniref:CSC1/OSCA1-like 7TM region domain-containing protein n=1 Tax=Schizophyllum amplum TaxID=97359 RepID=A0A550CH61_9AGAR|nr:hypothetical protein BD626DRAFT_493819 [Auriculariopsis ampla]
MGDIQTRPFSKNYSGLVNQSVIALGLAVICISGHELMKRRRRGKHYGKGEVGSRESWEFGYLFGARSWARLPTPPAPLGYPFAWVKQAVMFPEEKMNELRGLDATLYIRFLRGCFWFALLHSLTTFPILFPIHVRFSEQSVSPKSMTRASISSLVLTEHGRSLLWMHICLLIWVTVSWMIALLWICHGAFRLRAASIAAVARRLACPEESRVDPRIYYPHPHPQYGFVDVPDAEVDKPIPGLRLRTVMVCNIPPGLRREKDLKEYFEYYMTRKLDAPALPIMSSTRPGFINKSFAFIFNRAKRLPKQVFTQPQKPSSDSPEEPKQGRSRVIGEVPCIEKVVVVRKMTELASLLERREEILRLLETAHVKLAKKAVTAPAAAARCNSRAAHVAKSRKAPDLEVGDSGQEGTMTEEERLELVVSALQPFVDEFGLHELDASKLRAAIPRMGKHAFRQLRAEGSSGSDDGETEGRRYASEAPAGRHNAHRRTVWDALLSLPRDTLDAYQPLISLSHLFRGKTVPAVDYYSAKLNLITTLITENRARAACKQLAVHPENPLTCMVSMAPAFSDIDWTRMMKNSFDAEFVKDWVVSLGVWGFTIFWLFPVSLLVGLVSIQNISSFWPQLKAYLDRHPWEEEVIQSFLPTILVALLALLIPLVLLLIAKKAHTITTLSAMHDRILTRYYKFLIVNVLVFFCVGTAALQTVIESFRADASTPDILGIVADSFPTAGPFYVGWLIFTTALHAGFEISLFGLPLILYPATRSQVTPRKRSVGTRPAPSTTTVHWLPNHLLVVNVLVLFAVLNPFVLPFGAIYFFVQCGVIKNQLLHVYAKNYEANGQVLLIRMAVFLAYMVVLKKSSNFICAAVLVCITAAIKLVLTRMIRAQFERDDAAEASVVCFGDAPPEQDNFHIDADNTSDGGQTQDGEGLLEHSRSSFLRRETWKVPGWINFEYSTIRKRNEPLNRRRPIPFRRRTRWRTEIGEADVVDSPTSTNEATVVGHLDSAILKDIPMARTTSPKSMHRRLDSDATERPPAPLVVRHPPMIPWDDQVTEDIAYDNPYYTRAIANVLWLPRDPFGPLDLNDTVDLKRSLTVEESAGEIGTWIGVGHMVPPTGSDHMPLGSVYEPSQAGRAMSVVSEMESLSSPSEMGMMSTTRSNSSLLFQYDGTEDIELPPGIARRVGECDTERAPVPPPVRDDIALAVITWGSGIGSGGARRPSVTMRPRLHSFRSFSDGSNNSPFGSVNRARTTSVMSSLHPPTLKSARRARSTDVELGVRPDAHAQAEFVEAAAGSHHSINGRPQNINSHQAILTEVIAEEEAALQRRLEEEQQEAEVARRTANKSWMTSWLYKKPTLHPDSPPAPALLSRDGQHFRAHKGVLPAPGTLEDVEVDAPAVALVGTALHRVARGLVDAHGAMAQLSY